MNGSQRRALEYVKNTNGGATQAYFIDDHAPIGEILWRDIEGSGFAKVNAAGFIELTKLGEAALL